MLEQDGLLPKWSNHLCPRCWKGTLRSMVHQDLPKYKCCAKACRSMVAPHELHPLFQVPKGKQHQPLQVQAALLLLLLLLLLLTGASHAQCRLLLQVNHKMTFFISSKCVSCPGHVQSAPGSSAVLCAGRRTEDHLWRSETWMDVEADEATFDRADVTRDVTYKDSVAKGKPSLGAVVWHTCARQSKDLGFDTPYPCSLRQKGTWSWCNPQGGLDPIGPEDPEASCRSQSHFAH